MYRAFRMTDVSRSTHVGNGTHITINLTETKDELLLKYLRKTQCYLRGYIDEDDPIVDLSQ